jgi:hypothetical protein
MRIFGRKSDKPIDHYAKLIHESFVENAFKNFFDQNKLYVPPEHHLAFKRRIYLYCEAITLYTLFCESQYDSKYEELLHEYEKIIFPPEPTAEALEKLENIKSAMGDFATLIEEEKKLSWCGAWYQAFGYNETNPIALMTLLAAFSTTAKGVRESLLKLRDASLL